jgi:UDP-N-acetylmuramoyl-L-alanyl-D-glutamate--2,6-diaminopimelate ligase
MKKLIPQSIKNIYHFFQAVFANFCFGFPSRKMIIVGVTGTNGKTTTCQMISKILEENGAKVAMVSTINFKIGGKEQINKSKFTTLSSWDLQKFLKKAAAEKCEYAVLEISSHSLDQYRVWGVNFDVAVLTNITREHLDYHKTMEGYSSVKERLFAAVAQKIGGASVINLNSQFVENFLKHEANRNFGYFLDTQNPKCLPGKELEVVVAINIQANMDGSRFSVLDQQFEIFLPGKFNIENALAAICVGLSQRIELSKISSGLKKLKSVPGRMEKIENDRGIEIIVDYAVTPDSLEKLYKMIWETRKSEREKEKKIIAVFGACGERDQGKRPIMGEIVAYYTDYCFVTNEDPYFENPQKIIDEVFEGTKKYKEENKNSFRVLDRKEAIGKALQVAKPGDIVVVTGKGAEETMAVGRKKIPWNDPKTIREALQELK